MRYGDRLTFALMTMLFPVVDLRNEFHLDHIYAAARFTRRKLLDAGVQEDKLDTFIEYRDRLGNLQLLQGAMNTEKNAKMPAEWLSETYPDDSSKNGYMDSHALGDVPANIAEFDMFYEARRERLKARIGELLGWQA